MSNSVTFPPPLSSGHDTPGRPVAWSDPRREAAFRGWLETIATAHQLLPASLRIASADASFRRYLRVDIATTPGTSRIIMDAPPEQEDCTAFVRVAGLMAAAGLNVPRILAWDQALGFMLLDDLGAHTMMDAVAPADPAANLPLYLQAVDALVAWQLASQPGVLPAYDAPLLMRELALFPDWYLAKHRGVAVEGELKATLDGIFQLVVERNLAVPNVYVHRDFMPRNLMMPRDVAPTLPTACGSLALQAAAPPEAALLQAVQAGAGRLGAAALSPEGATEIRLGVLDFQDAVYGPITYDIASLMRDAFLSWDEDFVLDVTVRYWQNALKAGLPVDRDFGEFYRAVEWMGLQRHLKVAGIFARLTLRDGKPKYLADTPRFIAYIRATASRYRELKPLLRLIDKVEGSEAVSGFAYGRM